MTIWKKKSIHIGCCYAKAKQANYQLAEECSEVAHFATSLLGFNMHSNADAAQPLRNNGLRQ
jgi:hypothetical protein